MTREQRSQARRDELADAALATLAELGYARTSLREIAARMQLSHGAVHYFFADKNALISYAVRRYKDLCATRYDAVVDSATTPEQLRAGFAAALAVTMEQDAGLHRLWYDLRAQAMVEPSLRADVRAIDARLEQMIGRVVARYAELLRDNGSPSWAQPDDLMAYTALDGLFEHFLLLHLCGDSGAGASLVQGAADLLDRLFGRA